LPESYLLLFFSLTFFLHPCGVQPFEILREIAVNIYRVLRVDSPTHYRFDIRIFRIGDVQRKQTGAMFDHLSFSAQV
jgi:hypothetical protein